MEAGKLNKRITIQRQVLQKTSSNQKVGEWEDVCTVWAQVVCTASNVVDGDRFIVHGSTYKFYIRRRDGITAQMRVKWKNRIFVLEGPPVDWKNEQTGMTLVARELV